MLDWVQECEKLWLANPYTDDVKLEITCKMMELLCPSDDFELTIPDFTVITNYVASYAVNYMYFKGDLLKEALQLGEDFIAYISGIQKDPALLVVPEKCLMQYSDVLASEFGEQHYDLLKDALDQVEDTPQQLLRYAKASTEDAEIFIRYYIGYVVERLRLTMNIVFKRIEETEAQNEYQVLFFREIFGEVMHNLGNAYLDFADDESEHIFRSLILDMLSAACDEDVVEADSGFLA